LWEKDGKYLDTEHEMVQSETNGLLRLSRLILAYEMVSCFVIVFAHGYKKFGKGIEWHDVEVGYFICEPGSMRGSGTAAAPKVRHFTMRHT